jgi:hypothetical protein
MSNDNFCPRCDHPLNPGGEPVEPRSAPLPSEDRSQLPTTELPPVEQLDSEDRTSLELEAGEAEPLTDSAVALDAAPVLLEPAIQDEDSTEFLLPEPAPSPDDTGELESTHAREFPIPALPSDSAPDELAEAAATEIRDAPAREFTERDTLEEPVPDLGEAEVTQPRLDIPPEIEPPVADDLAAATHPRIFVTPEAEPSELPTSRFARDAVPEPDVAPARQAYIIPPAPYTPPPAAAVPPPPVIAPPAPAYGYAVPPAFAYLQQRVQSYLRGGYELIVNAPHEATLARGKRLGPFGWLLAIISIIGVFWYLLVLLMSGFRKDMAYLTLEADGHVYEDGSGAAHIREGRARAGRRWALIGLVMFAVCLILAVVLAAVAGVMTRQERFQTALREAYPAVTLFEERFSDADADPDDVALVKDGAVAWSIVSGIAVVGLWGGLTLFVIGTIHARAYHVRVPPLPGYA